MLKWTQKSINRKKVVKSIKYVFCKTKYIPWEVMANPVLFSRRNRWIMCLHFLLKERKSCSTRIYYRICFRLVEQNTRENKGQGGFKGFERIFRGSGGWTFCYFRMYWTGLPSYFRMYRTGLPLLAVGETSASTMKTVRDNQG